MQGILHQREITNVGCKLAIALICSLFILITSCSTAPKRPAYSGADSVGALTGDSFVGTWRYSILNPSVAEERNVSATYRFDADGSFTANTEISTDFPMKMESTGTWEVDDEMFVISIDDVQETSGNEIAALAVSFTKGLLQKQSGAMNPYSISSNQIVMVSPEHGSALQLDRL